MNATISSVESLFVVPDEFVASAWPFACEFENIYTLFVRSSFVILAWICIVGCDHKTVQPAAQEYMLMSHDFGDVFIGSTHGGNEVVLKNDFICHNTSIETLNLDVIGTSCSCTKTKISRRNVRSGERFKVSVQVEIAGGNGPIQDYALVGDENVVGSLRKLLITANIVQRVELAPLEGIPMCGPSGVNLSAKYRCEIRRPARDPEMPLAVCIRPDATCFRVSNVAQVEPEVTTADYESTSLYLQNIR